MHRLEEVAMAALEEDVCALGQQTRDVHNDSWALLAEVPHH